MRELENGVRRQKQLKHFMHGREGGREEKRYYPHPHREKLLKLAFSIKMFWVGKKIYKKISRRFISVMCRSFFLSLFCLQSNNSFFGYDREKIKDWKKTQWSEILRTIKKWWRAKADNRKESQQMWWYKNMIFSLLILK